MYKCKICGKEFETGRKLGSHVSSAHHHYIKKRINVLKECPICKKYFYVERTVDKNGKQNIGTREKRYCDRKCANKRIDNRKKINRKISKGLKKFFKNNKPLKKYNKNERKVIRKKQSESLKEYYRKKRERIRRELPFEKWSKSLKYDTLFEERGHICEECGYSYTDVKTDKGPYEIHHKDGDRANWKKDNLEILCLNCHWKTENWRFRGRKHTDKAKRKLRNYQLKIN